ncbi:MAG: hypothetical protein ACR2M5_08955 [Nakamurella sp.]
MSVIEGPDGPVLVDSRQSLVSSRSQRGAGASRGRASYGGVEAGPVPAHDGSALPPVHDLVVEASERLPQGTKPSCCHIGQQGG